MKKYCFFFIFLITSIIFSQNDSLNRGRVHYDLFIGTFVPTQNAKLIGVKPVFGASFGIKHKRMNYDLTFDVRIGKSKHKYQLANAELSNNYVGGYLGIDILRDVWTHKKNQILLLDGELNNTYDPDEHSVDLFAEQLGDLHLSSMLPNISAYCTLAAT